MSDYILAIDQGTTGSTALLIGFAADNRPWVVNKATVDFAQHFPKPGWVEHDLDEIWASVAAAVKQCFAEASAIEKHFTPDRVAAIGITNQRETLCLFDRESSEPRRRAIVWQCRRSSEICAGLKREGLEARFRRNTGLVLDPYFSGTKLKWVLDNDPDMVSEINSGKTVIGTIDTYLLHRLTGGVVHATEPSNASRTLLFDIHKQRFTPELYEVMGLKNPDALPEVKDSSTIFGKTRNVEFLPDGIPIAGMLGDQQAALAGQTCFRPGEAKCTYGTGAFLLLNTGEKAVMSENGLLTTVAWRLGGRAVYALEGASFIAGATMQFLRDQFLYFGNVAETEKMATDVVAAPEVYFVPALAGLGAPYWNPYARGAIMGLTRGTSIAQVVRAGLEGMCFQVNDLISAMNQDADHSMTILRVDGGATVNNQLMQIQADYSNLPVDRPQIIETTAFGSGLFAAMGVGLFAGLSDIADLRLKDKVFEPDAAHHTRRAEHLAGWERAVRAVEVFAGKS